MHYCDPFDRMMIAQGLLENIPIVTPNAVLDQNSAARIW
jgi:PIN domain nuclease of toxin-antitoxin system